MKWIPLILIFVINTTQAQMDTTSYSAGLIIAKNLKAQGINELDVNSFVQAVEDVFRAMNTKYRIKMPAITSRSIWMVFRMQPMMLLKLTEPHFLKKMPSVRKS